MTRPLFALLATLAAVPAPVPALAETLVATRSIPSRTLLAAEDLAVIAETRPGALRHPDEAIGMETRVALYPGRPVRADDLVPPALVDRNQIVILVYRSGGLTIATEGRALDRAAAGDRVRAINLASRTTVSGTVGEDGHVRVGPSDALLNYMETP